MLVINLISSWYIVVVYNWIKDFNINDEFLCLKIIYILIFLPLFWASYDLRKIWIEKLTCPRCKSGDVEFIPSYYTDYYRCNKCNEIWETNQESGGGWPD